MADQAAPAASLLILITKRQLRIEILMVRMSDGVDFREVAVFGRMVETAVALAGWCATK
jgi:hypothetical protein